MRNPDGSQPEPELRLAHCSAMLTEYLTLMKQGYLFSYDTRRHCQKWAENAAHAVYQMYPYLREDGSLTRYFVAKEGRKKGHRGVALTRFVEREIEQGTWWKLVPEDVLLGKLKTA